MLEGEIVQNRDLLKQFKGQGFVAVLKEVEMMWYVQVAAVLNG